VADAIREFEDNVEAADAWNGPLFDVWIEYRDIVAEGLREHGETAIARGIGCPALRPGPVLDGERGHGQRHPQARGLRGRPPGPARPPYKIGKDLEHAVAFNMALGPAAEVLRMWGDRVDEIRPAIADQLRPGALRLRDR
jgi:hypothetical protein